MENFIAYLQLVVCRLIELFTMVELKYLEHIKLSYADKTSCDESSGSVSRHKKRQQQFN